MYGPVTEEVWGVRTNEELRQLYKTADPVADIKRRPEKLGNAISTDEAKVTTDTLSYPCNRPWGPIGL
jgi:hypothetical protein